MTDRLYVRQVTDNHFQWRKLTDDGQWHDEVHAGTPALLGETLATEPLPLSLLLPGQLVVLRNMPVEGTEKRHLAKLMPFEMEEHLIDPVEELHFAFGNIEDGRVNVVYLDRDVMQASLDKMLSAGADIQHVFPEYLVLDHDDYDGVIVLEGENVIAKFGQSHGFTTEINLAPYVLEHLLATLNLPQPRIRLVAESVENIALLKSSLPDDLVASEALQLDEQLGSYWDFIETSLSAGPLNLRTGPFGRQLPLARWWGLWKVPAYVAAAAFVLSFSVNLGAYYAAKSESVEIRKEIESVYLQAVPGGRRGDEENRLRKLLESDAGSNSGAPTNLMVMLSGLSDVLTKQKDIQLSNFRYNGEQRELNINIEVKGLSELGQFREMLTANGLESGSPRTSRQGEVYQASMKLTEKN